MENHKMIRQWLGSYLQRPGSWLFLVAIVLLLQAWSRGVDGSDVTKTTFRAAVYEHRVYQPSVTNRPVPRSVALANMYKNLDVLDTQVRMAKRQNADIFVFPEDGIYGQDYNREGMYPYLETIPDPDKVTWSPCTDPTRYPESEVQYRLSCAALHNRMYVVADMGDKVPCNHQTDPKCPKDGRYQYNTNVAYDPQGTLVARYHKRHLYFENQFDTPDVEIRYFDTPFGRFGLIVCFDTLYHDPAVSLVMNHNVTNILLPTAWPDLSPIFTAIGFHSSFARRMGVNVLSANMHLLRYRVLGSGIYTPKGMASFYHNSAKGSSGKLLVSDIPVLQEPSIVKSRPSELGTSHGIVRVRAPSGDVVRNIGPWSGVSGPTFKNGKEFHASILYDRYTLNVLQGSHNETRVCDGGVCCYLKYEIQQSYSLPGYVFALAAFDGLHRAKGQFYLQNCLLVKCKIKSGKYSCGSVARVSDTKFKYLYLQGWFQTKYVFPEVLLTNKGELQLSKANEWNFASVNGGGQNSFFIESLGFSNPVSSVSLVGRCYDKDDVTL